jgi:hypothetical protein
MSETPLTDLQIAVSIAVEKAQTLPPASVGANFEGLMGFLRHPAHQRDRCCPQAIERRCRPGRSR